MSFLCLTAATALNGFVPCISASCSHPRPPSLPWSANRSSYAARQVRKCSKPARPISGHRWPSLNELKLLGCASRFQRLNPPVWPAAPTLRAQTPNIPISALSRAVPSFPPPSFPGASPAHQQAPGLGEGSSSKPGPSPPAPEAGFLSVTAHIPICSYLLAQALKASLPHRLDT